MDGYFALPTFFKLFRVGVVASRDATQFSCGVSSKVGMPFTVLSPSMSLLIGPSNRLIEMLLVG